MQRLIYKYSLLSLIYASTFVTIAIAVFIIAYIVFLALPHLNLELLLSKPSYLNNVIGILPDILNTLYLIFTALLLVLPLGVGAAIYLNEYAKGKKAITLIEYAIETLAGIPSIIYGLVGMLVFVEFLGFKTSILAGSLTLVIMSLPIVIRTTQESLKTVDKAIKDGAYALGAKKSMVIKSIVVPMAIDGIVTSCILSVGRMIGESAALLFTAGFAHALNGYFDALGSSGSSLSVALYVYAKEQGEFDVAFAIAFVLIVLCLLINTATYLICNKIKK